MLHEVVAEDLETNEPPFQLQIYCAATHGWRTTKKAAVEE